MAFLELNGIDVPVKEGGINQKVLNIGEKKRAYAGNMMSTRRARKRGWVIKTTILSRHDADGIEAIISGTGDSYSCDWDRADTADRYSSKGDKNSNSTYGVVIPGEGIAGRRVYDAAGVTESAFGSGAFSTQDGTANMLPTGVATCSDLAEFSFSGTTDEQILTNQVSMFGVNALYLGIDDTGVISTNVNPPAASAGTTYTASVYVYTNDAISLTMALETDVGQAATVTVAATQAGAWNYLTVTGAAPSSTGSAYITITCNTAHPFDVYEIWIDGYKLEASTYPTAWSTPAGGTDANRAGGVTFDASALTSPRITIGGRIRIPASFSTSESRPLLEISSTISTGTRYNNLLLWINTAGALKAEMYQRKAGSGSYTTLGTATLTPTFDGTWGFFALVINSDISSGTEDTMTFYYVTSGGTLTSANFDAAWDWPISLPASLSAVSTISLGKSLILPSTHMDEARIDDVFCVNAALMESQVESIAGSSNAWGASPAVVMSGDVVNKPLIVLGSVNGINYKSAQTTDLTTFEGQSRTLELLVDEV